jgi:hypothetical protein
MKHIIALEQLGNDDTEFHRKMVSRKNIIDDTVKANYDMECYEGIPDNYLQDIKSFIIKAFGIIPRALNRLEYNRTKDTFQAKLGTYEPLRLIKMTDAQAKVSIPSDKRRTEIIRSFVKFKDKLVQRLPDFEITYIDVNIPIHVYRYANYKYNGNASGASFFEKDTEQTFNSITDETDVIISRIYIINYSKENIKRDMDTDKDDKCNIRNHDNKITFALGVENSDYSSGYSYNIVDGLKFFMLDGRVANRRTYYGTNECRNFASCSFTTDWNKILNHPEIKKMIHNWLEFNRIATKALGSIKDKHFKSILTHNDEW